MKLFKSLYLTNRFFLALILVIVLFIFGHYFVFLFAFAKVSALLLILFVAFDLLKLYGTAKNAIKAYRQTPDRLSNGDENQIYLNIKNNYSFPIRIEIIDEIPFQFQKRDFKINESLSCQQEKTFAYSLRPVKRGEYNFGNINIYIITNIGMISRRYIFGHKSLLPVYPSFIQMRKYELMAISNRLTDVGIKKIRRVSNQNEFDQIREYVKGDDFRTINWKATARKANYMVNQYQDERSQHVYNLIDMGRTMKMPFKGMSLLDYAINASLVISNIAVYKQDKAGIITFSNTIDSILPAQRKNNQVLTILELLYKQTTDFAESNFELLYSTVKRKIKQRSLLLLYTNFEGLSSLNRQMKYFQQLARNHLLVVIFFENTEIKNKLSQRPKYTEEIYIKTIAEKFIYEKKQIVKELNKSGIHAILTEPQDLNVATINKYLELKSLGLI